MPTYSSSSPTYAHGGQFDSPQWTIGSSTAALTNGGTIAWIRFAGAETLLGGAGVTVTSAIVTISAIGSPTTLEELRLLGDKSGSDLDLPSDYAEADARTLTTEFVEASVQNLDTIDFNVAAIVNEVRSAINGGVLAFRIDDPNYSGTGLSSLTASIVVNYDSDDAVVPAEGDGLVIEVFPQTLANSLGAGAVRVVPQALMETPRLLSIAVTPAGPSESLPSPLSVEVTPLGLIFAPRTATISVTPQSLIPVMQAVAVTVTPLGPSVNLPSPPTITVTPKALSPALGCLVIRVQPSGGGALVPRVSRWIRFNVFNALRAGQLATFTAAKAGHVG